MALSMADSHTFASDCCLTFRNGFLMSPAGLFCRRIQHPYRHQCSTQPVRGLGTSGTRAWSPDRPERAPAAAAMGEGGGLTTANDSRSAARSPPSVQQRATGSARADAETEALTCLPQLPQPPGWPTAGRSIYISSGGSTASGGAAAPAERPLLSATGQTPSTATPQRLAGVSTVSRPPVWTS